MEMKVFKWRHNRKFHSWSMMNEPNLNQDLYLDAVLIVQAETIEQAYDLVRDQTGGWNVEELKLLAPHIIEQERPQVIFAEIRGD